MADEPSPLTGAPETGDAPRQEIYRIDVVSDTHGTLPAAVWRACAGADLIVHAGDICGDGILDELELQAPVIAVLGNNDWPGQYGPDVIDRIDFERLGVTFRVAHISSHLGGLEGVRVAICGHTHVARVERVGSTTIVNPGSTTRPRGAGRRPTMARVTIGQNYVRSVQLLALDDARDEMVPMPAPVS